MLKENKRVYKTVEMMHVQKGSILHIPLQEMFKYLGEILCSITGFDSFSLQPNVGAAGEYVGLMVIRAYHNVGV